MAGRRGVPAETAADLFTYGFSTRAVDGGRPRGIGLALVDRISRRLGGTVEVSARAGEDASGNATGTVFTVRLPFAPVLAANRSGVHDPAPTSSH
ncbi:MAG: ATP-binding protein [Pseudonocardia sp.]|nr:ATP-binding protein [Pseudonocardia sp.]